MSFVNVKTNGRSSKSLRPASVKGTSVDRAVGDSCVHCLPPQVDPVYGPLRKWGGPTLDRRRGYPCNVHNCTVRGPTGYRCSWSSTSIKNVTVVLRVGS